MTFWEELRQQVRERTTAGDITYELYDRIAATGVSEVAVIQPTFYLGRFSVLTHDFMDLTERLLDAPEGDLGYHLRAILYLREGARTMARVIRYSSEPMESLLQFLEECFEESIATEEGEEEEHEHEHEHEGEGAEMLDLFAREREALRESLRVKLRSAKLSDSVVDELSDRLAESYHGCVRFTHALKHLTSLEPDDLAGILATMVDLQYIMDFELRKLLLEDVFLDETPTFTTGLMPWLSHCTEELARKVADTRMAPAPPAAAPATL